MKSQKEFMRSDRYCSSVKKEDPTYREQKSVKKNYKAMGQKY